MSRDVPQNAGELSTQAMLDALDVLDEALKDAPPEVRAALGVVRLVESMPRAAPWFGVSMRIGGESVPLGTALGNAFEAVGDWPWDSPVRADHWFTRRHLLPWRNGKSDYDAYLDSLRAGWKVIHQQDAARPRMTPEEAERAVAQISDYLVLKDCEDGERGFARRVRRTGLRA